MEIRRSYDRLISTMGVPILARRHRCIKSGPSCPRICMKLTAYDGTTTSLTHMIYGILVTALAVDYFLLVSFTNVDRCMIWYKNICQLSNISSNTKTIKFDYVGYPRYLAFVYLWLSYLMSFRHRYDKASVDKTILIHMRSWEIHCLSSTLIHAGQ